MALRPSEVGVVHDNAADVDAATPATPVGRSGTVAIRTGVDLADSGERPAEFTTTTVNVNDSSWASPEIRHIPPCSVLGEPACVAVIEQVLPATSLLEESNVFTS